GTTFTGARAFRCDSALNVCISSTRKPENASLLSTNRIIYRTIENLGGDYDEQSKQQWRREPQDDPANRRCSRSRTGRDRSFNPCRIRPKPQADPLSQRGNLDRQHSRTEGGGR